MDKEIKSILHNLQRVNSGEPWFGRSVFVILDEIDPSIVHQKPNETSHSLIELLYHMLTWAEFTLKRIEKDDNMDLAAFEKMDWREINPATDSWQKGLAELKNIHHQIVALLGTKDDEFLNEIVDYRKYNFRFLMNGLIQHNIYHLGQVAYLNKLLS
jgi:uncharacterized damage-inducible protein DinB